MEVFLEAQLDFIYFFYGLAFILLGAVCGSIAREPQGKAAGMLLLAGFGLVHGLGEWLDLAVSVIDDTPAFVIIRAIVMTVSFLLLAEFARSGAVKLGLRMPGYWVYVPAVAIVLLAGIAAGPTAASAIARYTLGLAGAIGTAAVLMARARQRAALAQVLTICCAAVFALYGIATGVIVPDAPFWPADTVNATWFLGLTGIPIQLVRGLLACVLATLFWAVWAHLLIVAVDSGRYAAQLRKQFVRTLAVVGVILLAGWFLTNFLGNIYHEEIQDEARGDIDLLTSRLAGETVAVDGMVKALAGSPLILPLLSGAAHDGRAQHVLSLDVESAGAMLGHILDSSGAVVASSDLREFALLGAANEQAAPYFQQAMAGGIGRQFALDPVTQARLYFASHPIRNGDGLIVGVAVLKKSIDALEENLKNFDRAFFLLDDEGMVVLSNRPETLNRALWPLPNGPRLTLPDLFGAPDQDTPLAREVTVSAWTLFDDRRGYVLRRPIERSDWSMLIVIPVSGMFASRFLGIIITLQLAVTALFYFFGSEHGLRDSVQMERRLELLERAKSLQLQASTDPLTGLYNRLKIDGELLNELARSHRYHTPFALALFDIDHFKEVNDVWGHQMGDNVLVRLAEVALGEVRKTDVLARWGGEEFMVLLVGSSSYAAALFAEKLRIAIAHAPFGEVGTVTCSFGLANYVDGDTTESLIARADNALYRAKLNGRNRVEMDAEPLEEHAKPAPADL